MIAREGSQGIDDTDKQQTNIWYYEKTLDYLSILCSVEFSIVRSRNQQLHLA
jgi:hypothetical protein